MVIIIYLLTHTSPLVGEEEDSGRSSWSEETLSEASGSSSVCEKYPDVQWPTSFSTQIKVRHCCSLLSVTSCDM